MRDSALNFKKKERHIIVTKEDLSAFLTAQQQVANTRIYAPIDGIVAKRAAEIGQRVLDGVGGLAREVFGRFETAGAKGEGSDFDLHADQEKATVKGALMACTLVPLFCKFCRS